METGNGILGQGFLDSNDIGILPESHPRTSRKRCLSEDGRAQRTCKPPSFEAPASLRAAGFLWMRSGKFEVANQHDAGKLMGHVNFTARGKRQGTVKKPIDPTRASAGM